MQGLEKILEEMNRQLELSTSREYRRGWGACKDRMMHIVRKHINDGWVSVEERMPMRTLDEKINESYQKYLVFIDGVDGWDIDIAVYDFWNDKKWREAHGGYGEIENVIAWRPLPEPYRPERSNNHDGE